MKEMDIKIFFNHSSSPEETAAECGFTLDKYAKKEFDLLRISNGLVINIELKSHATSEKVLRQLKKNEYYLKFLCRTVKLFSYVEEDKTFYQLTENGELEIVDISEVCSLLRQQESCYVGDLEDLFRTSDFLVSPINSPDRFINGEYFLSQQQNEVVEMLEWIKP